MADSTAGAIGAAAVQTLGNYAVQVAANKKQFKYQKQAMALQQDYNKQLWDYQNAYNTPQAQMDRLLAAGLNPRLIYTSGQQSAGNAGPIAPTDVPARSASRMEMPDLYNRHLIARQADAQYRATMQNIESARVTQELNQTRIALGNLNVMREALRSKNYKDLAQAEVDTQKFVALRSGELFNKTRTDVSLGDQLYNFRAKSNDLSITSQTLDNAFKQNRNDLAELGIYSSDHPAMRVLIQAAKRMGVDLGELLARGADKLKYLLDVAK